jgi:hypothetical protein
MHPPNEIIHHTLYFDCVELVLVVPLKSLLHTTSLPFIESPIAFYPAMSYSADVKAGAVHLYHIIGCKTTWFWPRIIAA